MQCAMLTGPLQRFRNEVRVYDLLRHGDADAVSLVGVYSTDKHPFGLVYEHMENLDLGQYLKNEPDVGRLKLVLVSMHPPLRQLSDASR